MPLKNIILTGSIGSIPTHSYGQKMYISSTEQQSFPIERITGSSGGAFPEFNGGYSTTGLFVNITQSYSESIDTIAGIRTFLHDTQEEFINGEFSGSKLIVADQRLIDEDCVEFLNVNTTLVNYKTYFYYSSASLYNETPIENFLNNNTAPNDGEIYLYWNKSSISGISYIKIARKDVQGNNNTLSLQELTNLRLKFSDVSSVTDYPIATITERPSYYLYTLSSLVNVTSSADNNVINHAFSASAFTTPVTVSGNSGATIAPYTINTDAANYMGVVQYIFGDTPNHTIQYFATALFTPTTTQTVSFSLQNTNVTIASSSPTISVPTMLVLQGSASFTENQFLTLHYFNPDPSNSYTISDVRWSFTQSLTPNTASTLTVLEPYLTNNFRNSDCDVTMNNVSEQEVSGLYRRVNYNSGVTIPTNQQQIISQSAEFADVKDYNYSARAHILPRYNGVRTVQKNENVYTEGEYSIDNITTVDVGFGKTPSVQSLGTYFAYFNYLEETNPELIDKATAHILYLIDIDGNVLTPSLSSSYYYNLIDNFESGKKANVILNAISGNPQTIGNIPIIRAGAIPMPIIASQTGSLSNPYNIQSTMSFGTSGSNIPNYNSMFVNQSSQTIEIITGGNYEVLDIPTTIFKSNIERGSNILTVNKSSNLTKLNIQITLNGAFLSEVYSGASYTSFPLAVSVLVSTDGGASFGTPLYTWDQIISTTAQTLIFTTQLPIIPINSYQYKIIIYNASGYYDVIIPSSQVKIIQFPQTSIREVYSGSEGFFTSSLQSSNVLTGSYFMSLMYNPANPLTQQNNTPQFSSSGYSPFLPFAIQPGDQIRFEGDETQVYNIISATPQIGFASMSILLDGNVSSGSNLNSFLIRRFDPNPNFITIDSNLNTYTGGGGFILPKFITNEMQENFNKNVVSLKERGLIEVSTSLDSL